MKKQGRESVDEYFMKIALLTAERSTCVRAKVGAVLVRDGYVLSTGFNGSPRGKPHCVDVGCTIVEDSRGYKHCIGTVHSELNCLIQSPVSPKDCTLYCTHFACVECSKAMINAGIKRFVYKHHYIDANSSFFAITMYEYLEEAGIEVIGIDDQGV